MIREGNSSTDPYTKFKSAGKLAKTVAHWKTKGIDVAVSTGSSRSPVAKELLISLKV